MLCIFCQRVTFLEMETFLQTCHVGLGPHSAQGKQSDGLRSGNLGGRFLRMIINHDMVAGAVVFVFS